MATNVAERIRQLAAYGTIPNHATYRILETGLTYEQANQREATLREACGAHCQGQAGGHNVPGREWSVYRVDW